MSVANRPVHRPLSPHLQIYKWQLTSILSILHRATGIALTVGALYLVLWVICATSPNAYSHFQSFNTSILGRIVLGGWLFSAFYHLCNGIRHLFWDAGRGFDKTPRQAGGWVAISGAVILTLGLWAFGWRHFA